MPRRNFYDKNGSLRSRLSAREKFDRTLDGGADVLHFWVVQLSRVAVIEAVAEIVYVAVELLYIFRKEIIQCGGKLGEIALLQFRRRDRHEHIIMRNADIFLRFEKILELRVFHKHGENRFEHMIYAPVYLAAHKAGLLDFGGLFRFCVFRKKQAFFLKNIFSRVFKIAVQHKPERQAVVLLKQHFKMREAEAKLVCFHSYVRLHHCRAHDIFAYMLLDRVAHGAYRAAAPRLENFVYGYR